MVTPNIVLIRLWMENSELGAGLQLTTTQSRARDYFQKKNYVKKQSVRDMKNEWAQSAVRRSPVFTSASQLSRVAKINCNCHCSSRSGPALKGTPGLSWLLQRLTILKHPQTNGIAHPKSHPTSQTNTTQQSQRPHQQPSQNTPDYDDQWHCLSQHHNSTTQHRSKEHNTIITVAQQTTNNYPKTPPDSDAHLMDLATPRCSSNKSHPLNSL